MMNNPTSNMAFNGDGTQLITLVQNGGTYPAYYPLGTPYDPTSINGPIVISPYSINGSASSGLFFADGGMKAYMTGSNSGFQWNLASPYDMASFSGDADATFSFSSVFTIGMSGMQQFALNADGTIGYLGVLGGAFEGSMIQFSLGTAFDISTVNSTPVELLPLGGGYGTYSGVALNSAGNKLIITGPNSSAQPVFYQLTGV